MKNDAQACDRAWGWGSPHLVLTTMSRSDVFPACAVATRRRARRFDGFGVTTHETPTQTIVRDCRPALAKQAVMDEHHVVAAAAPVVVRPNSRSASSIFDRLPSDGGTMGNR
jgi:hypothetical protein